METTRKSAAVAVLLTLVLPGLGHFYLRRWVAGALFLAASVVLFRLLVAAVPLEELASGHPPEEIGALAGYTVALLGLLVLCLWDVYRAARRG